MQRLFQLFAFALTAVVLFSVVPAFSQDTNNDHYYTMTTWKIRVPEGGSRAEFADLMKEWAEKVTRKNPKVVSETVLQHAWSDDNRDVIIISEYANWNDIEAAQDEQDKLVKAGWPDEEARKAFNKKFGSYFMYHSDGIFVGRPELGK